jgi:hypothetical protein
MEGGNGSWAASPDAASMSVAVGRHCSGAGILDRFWLEFSAVIPWLGGAESDEGLEVFGRAEGVYSEARF